ncbi:MAG TPA: hypothetical protein VGM12_10615, partial [Trebonia sp.]
MGNIESNERPGMTRRALMVAVPLGSALALASGQHQADAAGDQASSQPVLAADEQGSGGDTAFQDLNGFMWFYSTYFGYKFTDITRDLDNLKRDGIRVLGFFCPYNGD